MGGKQEEVASYKTSETVVVAASEGKKPGIFDIPSLKGQLQECCGFACIVPSELASFSSSLALLCFV